MTNILVAQGCASVSLADFDPKDVISVRWYNVLSFKFMQPDSGSSQGNTRVTEGDTSIGERSQMSYTTSETSSHSTSTTIVRLF